MELPPTTTELSVTEFKKLLATDSLEEWKLTCNEIKEIRNGMYPSDWLDKIVFSEILAEKFNKQSNF